MRFAVIGDIHADFAKADAMVRRRCGPVDAIFSVGDAEPNRTEADSLGVGGPAKYRKVGDFPEFVAGWRLPPSRRSGSRSTAISPGRRSTCCSIRPVAKGSISCSRTNGPPGSRSCTEVRSLWGGTRSGR
ncbi:MAG TPA: hypothetical protein VM347_38390 [Nonomuraea sp.]|nr:hypothetical protein [Nonomuraea sp.]